MRRRLKKFLPMILIALLVQILAPIGACWAAIIAASDPLAAAVICHGGASGQGQADQNSDRARDGCCSACSVMQTGAPIDAPDAAATVTIERGLARVVWADYAPDLIRLHAGSHAQARAPPSMS